MDESRDKRVMELVHACADMTADARAKFLDSHCNGDGDGELRSEVELLIGEGVEKTGSYVLSHHLDANLPDHYKLVGLIGSGGMAEVFLAEDTRLDRRVAIKFLNDTFRRDPERMKRFNQEARAASALNHPNILTIHDIGEVDGVQYIVSEFVDGETLGTRIGRGKLSAEDTVEIAIQIASALSAAHSAGIVHRDLKPDNVMLRSDGSVKVVDFGLAKSSGGTSHDALTIEAVTTSPGMILGTPRYMSPEQTRAQPLDGRSDIFSLGIILFEMLTGRSPFGGSNVADVIAAILAKGPRKIADFVPDTPPELEAVVYKALQKDRDKRFGNIGEMLAELKDVRNALIGSSQGVRETRRAGVVQPGAGYLKWALIGLALVVLGGGAWLWFGRGRTPLLTGAMRSVPVTSWSTVSAEAVSAASFSPDARMIAFASTKNGPSELWVKQTTGGDPVQVTKNGFYNQYPVWSPDGQEIAYFSSRGETRGIWKVAFTGGHETQLVNALSPSARPIRWTANKKLFYQDGARPEVFVLDASGQVSKVTDLAAASIGARAVAVAPDGASFAISVKEDGVWKVKTRRFDAGEFREVATSKDQIDNIAFHPNGTDLFFTGAVDGTYQIFAAGPGLSAFQVSSGNNDLSLQDVSADGSKVLYHSITETSDLWNVSLSDGEEVVVANDVAEEYWPAISPDGKNVAYQSVAQPDRPFRGAILVKPITGGSAVQVAAEGFSPVWSPDGDWIAFFRREAAEISIWKVRPTGADLTNMVDKGVASLGYANVPYLKTTIEQISWARDSSSIAYSAKLERGTRINSAPVGKFLSQNVDGRSDETWCCAVWNADGSMVAYSVEDTGTQPRSYRIWTSARDGSSAKVFFETHQPFRFLGWSGAEIVIAQRSDPAVVQTVPASTSIFTISATGQLRKVSTLANAYFHNIHLSSDGQMVAFAARTNDASELWAASIRNGTQRRLTVEKDPKILISKLAWAPDGSSLIYGKQTRTNVLSLLTK